MAALIALSYINDFESRLFFRQKARLCWWSLKNKYCLNQTKKDVLSHYDRGNDFYKLWMDKGLNYSCAYFKKPVDTLEKAQLQKIHHTLNKLRLKPGHRLLDIGCDWRSLLIEAVKKFNVSAVGITLSEEQYRLGNKRLRQADVRHAARILLQDYRELAEGGEQFDRIVSIGMFEHVGKENIVVFFQKARKLLKPGGVILLHTICRMIPQELDPWIGTYIFPGGYIPATGEIAEAGEETGYLFLDAKDLRPHYDLTLGHWLRRFETNVQTIMEMMGEQFVRMWRVYLTGSQMAFRYGPLHVIQYLFAQGRRDDWPLTREWLFKS